MLFSLQSFGKSGIIVDHIRWDQGCKYWPLSAVFLKKEEERKILADISADNDISVDISDRPITVFKRMIHIMVRQRLYT